MISQNPHAARFTSSSPALLAPWLLIFVACSDVNNNDDRTSDVAELAQGLSADDGVQTPLPPGVVAQTAAEALEMDLALTAEGRGWSIEEARLHHAAAEAVGRVAIRLAKERPEIFVGSVVHPPAQRPSLLVKGETDNYLRASLRMKEQLSSWWTTSRSQPAKMTSVSTAREKDS